MKCSTCAKCSKIYTTFILTTKLARSVVVFPVLQKEMESVTENSYYLQGTMDTILNLLVWM